MTPNSSAVRLRGLMNTEGRTLVLYTGREVHATLLIPEEIVDEHFEGQARDLAAHYGQELELTPVIPCNTWDDVQREIRALNGEGEDPFPQEDPFPDEGQDG